MRSILTFSSYKLPSEEVFVQSCLQPQDQPKSGLQTQRSSSKKTPSFTPSNNELTSEEATCLACHRPSRKDVGTAAYWQRVRSLSRDNKKRMDARETQWRMAELEEAKRRKEILSQRRREKEELTERYMRKPLYAVRSSSVGAPEQKRTSSIITTRSVPDLEEAFRSIQQEQLARARSQTLTSSSCETWSTTRDKQSPSIYKKFGNPAIVNPPANLSPNIRNNRGRIIRENQKAYPTRSIEELKERHSINTSNKHIPRSTITRRRTYPRECTNRARSPVGAVSLPEASVIVLQKPKIIRRGSMPDLTKCKCISSTMVYDSVSALDNSLDSQDVIVLQKNKLSPSLYGATRIAQKGRTLNYLSKSLDNRSTGDNDQSISGHESIKRVSSSSTLSSKTYRSCLQMSRRKEWTAEQLSKNEFKRKVLSSENFKTLPTKASHQAKSVVKKLAVSSISSEGNESSFYDSLEEDNPSGKSKPRKKSFFIPLEGNGSCLLPATDITLPQRLSSRIKLLENVLQRPRTASNTRSNLNLRGKKIHPLQIEALLLSEGYEYAELEELDKQQLKKSQSIDSIKNVLPNEEPEKLPKLNPNQNNTFDTVKDHLPLNNLKFRPTNPIETVALNYIGLNKSENNQREVINLDASESLLSSKTSNFVYKYSVENKTNAFYSNFSDPSSVNIKVNSNSKIPICKIISTELNKGFEFNKTLDALHPEDENIDTSNLSSLSSDVSLSGMVDTNETFSLDTVSDCQSLTDITVNETKYLKNNEKMNTYKENEIALANDVDYAYKFTKTKYYKVASSPNEVNVKAIEGFAGNGREALLESGFGDDESCGSDPDNSTETISSEKTKSDAQQETCDVKLPNHRVGDSILEVNTTPSTTKFCHAKNNPVSPNQGNTSRAGEETQNPLKSNTSNLKADPMESLYINSEEDPSETSVNHNLKYHNKSDIVQQELEIVHIGTIEDGLISKVSHLHQEAETVSGIRSCSENETKKMNVYVREHQVADEIEVSNKDQGVLNTPLQDENENTEQNIESESSKATEFDFKDISLSRENEATDKFSSRTVSRGKVGVNSSVKHSNDENEIKNLSQKDLPNSSADDENGKNRNELSISNNKCNTCLNLRATIEEFLAVEQNIGIIPDPFPLEESEKNKVTESIFSKSLENTPSKLCRHENLSENFKKTINEADFESKADSNDISQLENKIEDISQTLSSIERVMTCEGEQQEIQCTNCELEEEEMVEGKRENASDTLFQFKCEEEYVPKNERCPYIPVDQESHVSIENGVKQESQVSDHISGYVNREGKKESEGNDANSQGTSDDISTNIEEIAESSNDDSKQYSFNLPAHFEVGQDEATSLEEVGSISQTSDINPEIRPKKQDECMKERDDIRSFEIKQDECVEDDHQKRCINAFFVNISAGKIESSSAEDSELENYEDIEGDIVDADEIISEDTEETEFEDTQENKIENDKKIMPEHTEEFEFEDTEAPEIDDTKGDEDNESLPNHAKEIESEDNDKNENDDAKEHVVEDVVDIELCHVKMIESKYVEARELYDTGASKVENAENILFEDANKIEPEHGKNNESDDTEEDEVCNVDDIELYHDMKIEFKNGESNKPNDTGENKIEHVEKIISYYAKEIELEEVKKSENIDAVSDIQSYCSKQKEANDAEVIEFDDTEKDKVENHEKIISNHVNEIEYENRKTEESEDTRENKVENATKMTPYNTDGIIFEVAETTQIDDTDEERIEMDEKIIQEEAKENESEDGEATKLEITEENKVKNNEINIPDQAEKIRSRGEDVNQLDDTRPNEVENDEKIIQENGSKIVSESIDKKQLDDTEEDRVENGKDTKPDYAKIIESEDVEVTKLDDTEEDKDEDGEKIVSNHAEEIEYENGDEDKLEDTEDDRVEDSDNFIPIHPEEIECEDVELNKPQDIVYNGIENEKINMPKYAKEIEPGDFERKKFNDTEENKVEINNRNLVDYVEEIEPENFVGDELYCTEVKIVEKSDKIISDYVEEIEFKNGKAYKLDNTEEHTVEDGKTIIIAHTREIESEDVEATILEDTQENGVKNEEKIIVEHNEKLESGDFEATELDDTGENGVEIEGKNIPNHRKEIESGDFNATENEDTGEKVENEKNISDYAKENESGDFGATKLDDTKENKVKIGEKIMPHHEEKIEFYNCESNKFDVTEKDRAEKYEKFIPINAEGIQPEFVKPTKLEKSGENDLENEEKIMPKHERKIELGDFEEKKLADTEEDEFEIEQKIIPDHAIELPSGSFQPTEIEETEENIFEKAKIMPSHDEENESEDTKATKLEDNGENDVENEEKIILKHDKQIELGNFEATEHDDTGENRVEIEEKNIPKHDKEIELGDFEETELGDTGENKVEIEEKNIPEHDKEIELGDFEAIELDDTGENEVEINEIIPAHVEEIETKNCGVDKLDITEEDRFENDNPIVLKHLNEFESGDCKEMELDSTGDNKIEKKTSPEQPEELESEDLKAAEFEDTGENKFENDKIMPDLAEENESDDTEATKSEDNGEDNVENEEKIIPKHDKEIKLDFKSTEIQDTGENEVEIKENNMPKHDEEIKLGDFKSTELDGTEENKVEIEEKNILEQGEELESGDLKATESQDTGVNKLENNEIMPDLAKENESEDAEATKLEDNGENKVEIEEKNIPEYNEEIKLRDFEDTELDSTDKNKIEINEIIPYHVEEIESENCEADKLGITEEYRVENGNNIILKYADEFESGDFKSMELDSTQKSDVENEEKIIPEHDEEIEFGDFEATEPDGTGENKVEIEEKTIREQAEKLELGNFKATEIEDPGEKIEKDKIIPDHTEENESKDLEAYELDDTEVDRVENGDKIIPKHAEEIEFEDGEADKLSNGEQDRGENDFKIIPDHAEEMKSEDFEATELDETRENNVKPEEKLIPKHVEEIEPRYFEATELGDTESDRVEISVNFAPYSPKEIESGDAQKTKLEDIGDNGVENEHVKVIEPRVSEAMGLDDTRENKVEPENKFIPKHAEGIESKDAKKSENDYTKEVKVDDVYDFEPYHNKTIDCETNMIHGAEVNKFGNSDIIIFHHDEVIESINGEQKETNDTETSEHNNIKLNHAKIIVSRDSKEIKLKNGQCKPNVNIEPEFSSDIGSYALQDTISNISEDNVSNIGLNYESLIAENFDISFSNNTIYLADQNVSKVSENSMLRAAIINESITLTDDACSVGLQCNLDVEESEQFNRVRDEECRESDIISSVMLIPETKKIFEETIREQEDFNLDRIDTMSSLSFNIGEDGSESSLSSDRITVVRNLVSNSRNSYSANSTFAISDIDIDHGSDICSNVDENPLSDHNEDQINTVERTKTSENAKYGSQPQKDIYHDTNETINLPLPRTLHHKVQKFISLGKDKIGLENIQMEPSDDPMFKSEILRNESEDLYSDGDLDSFSNSGDIIMNEEELAQLSHKEIRPSDLISEMFTPAVQCELGTSQSIDSNSDLSTIEEENEHSSDTLDDSMINVISQLSKENIRANNRSVFSHERSNSKALGVSLTQKEFERIRKLSLENQNFQSLESRDVSNFQQRANKWNENVSKSFINKPINNECLTSYIFLEPDCHKSNQHIVLSGEVDNTQSCSEEITFSSDLTKDETAHSSTNSLKVDYEEDLSKASSLNNSAVELEVDEPCHVEMLLGASDDNDHRAINETKLLRGPSRSKIESDGSDAENVVQQNAVIKVGKPTEETSFVLSDASLDSQKSLNFPMPCDTALNFAVDSLKDKHLKKTTICNSNNNYPTYSTKNTLKENKLHCFEVDNNSNQSRGDLTKSSNSLSNFSIKATQNEDKKNRNTDIAPLNKTKNNLTKENYQEKTLNCGFQSLNNSHYLQRNISYDQSDPILSSKSPSSDSGVMELAGPSKQSNKSRPSLIRETEDDPGSPELLPERHTPITSAEQKDKILLNRIISGTFPKEDVESMNLSGDSHSEANLWGELPNTPLGTDSEGSLLCQNHCIHDYDESMNMEAPYPSDKDCARNQMHMLPNDQQTNAQDSSDDEADVSSDYTLRLLGAFEKRRRRRHRYRPQNIDVDDFSRKDYRPPLLSNFDAFLASLSNYQSHHGLVHDLDQESRTDDKKEVTVEVSSGKETHDIRVKAEDKIRLLVEVTPSRSRKKFRISPKENSKMSLLSEVISHRKRNTRPARSESSSEDGWRTPRFNNYVGAHPGSREKKYLQRRISVNNEDGECDLSVRGNNIEKCFTAPLPGYHRHRLNVQNRVSPIVAEKKENRDHDPNTKDQRRIQRSIKAIKELLKTLT